MKVSFNACLIRPTSSNRSAGHVQSIESYDGLGRRNSRQTSPGIVLPRNVEGGKDFSIIVPVTKHLPVSILSATISQGKGIKMPRAAGIQVSDKSSTLLFGNPIDGNLIIENLKLFIFFFYHINTFVHFPDYNFTIRLFISMVSI